MKSSLNLVYNVIFIPFVKKIYSLVCAIFRHFDSYVRQGPGTCGKIYDRIFSNDKLLDV